MIGLFSVRLGWLPTGGYGTWQHFVMPAFTLGIGVAAVMARFTRSAMLEVLGQPYMRTALAKGVPWARAVRRHALPNAMPPILTNLGQRRRDSAAGQRGRLFNSFASSVSPARHRISHPRVAPNCKPFNSFASSVSQAPQATPKQRRGAAPGPGPPGRASAGSVYRS